MCRMFRDVSCCKYCEFCECMGKQRPARGLGAEGVQGTDKAVYQEIRKQRPARGLGAKGVQGTDKAVYQEIRKQRPARELGAESCRVGTKMCSWRVVLRWL